MDPHEVKRRVGRVSFDLLVLDLTNTSLLSELGVAPEELTSRDRRACQELADLAAQAGFEGVIGPSAAAANETTLAVFGPAIKRIARDVTDLGVRRPPTH